MTRILFILILISGSTFGVYSQSPFIESYRVNLFFGHRDLRIKNLPEGQNLNFINYMSFLDYHPIGAPYIGFSTHIQLRNGLDVDLKLFSNDDIYPSGGKMSVQYYWNDFLGMSIGMFAHPFWTSDYEEFHNTRDVQYYPLQNFHMHGNIYDMGWKIAPVLKYETGRFFANLRFNFGFSGFLPYADEIGQEMMNSNFRRIIRYETDFDMQFFLLPDMRAGMELINIGNSVLGIQLHTNYLISRRSLNYTRITYNWAYENPVIEEVSNPKHRFNIWNLDFGIFLRVNTTR